MRWSISFLLLVPVSIPEFCSSINFQIWLEQIFSSILFLRQPDSCPLSFLCVLPSSRPVVLWFKTSLLLCMLLTPLTASLQVSPTDVAWCFMFCLILSDFYPSQTSGGKWISMYSLFVASFVLLCFGSASASFWHIIHAVVVAWYTSKGASKLLVEWSYDWVQSIRLLLEITTSEPCFRWCFKLTASLSFQFVYHSCSWCRDLWREIYESMHRERWEGGKRRSLCVCLTKFMTSEFCSNV